MDFLNNPTLSAAARLERSRDIIVAEIADRITAIKTWQDMDMKERRICIRHTVSQAESEQDLEERLHCNLGLERFSINWHQWEPGSREGEEARMLAKALGYLVANSGALVDIVIDGDMF